MVVSAGAAAWVVQAGRAAGRYPARVLLGESVTVTVVVIVCALVLVASVIGIVRLTRGKKE